MFRLTNFKLCIYFPQFTVFGLQSWPSVCYVFPFSKNIFVYFFMNIFTVIACFLQKNHIVQNEWEKLLVDVFRIAIVKNLLVSKQSISSEYKSS